MAPRECIAGAVATPDGTLDHIAADQYGAFSLYQAGKAGLSRNQIQYRIDSGRWVKLSPGVYGLSYARDTFERRLVSSILHHPRAIAAGESAARLHQLRGYDDAGLEIMVPLTANARTPQTRVIRSVFFNTVDRTTVGGIEATSPAETVLTLAPRMSKVRLEFLLEQVLGSSQARLEEFVDILERCAGGRVKGVRNLRSLVMKRSPHADETSESVLEAALYRILNDSDMPSFAPQYRIDLPDREIRVDAFIPEWRLIVEADGRNWHARSQAFRRDRQRDNQLQAIGFRVCRLTYEDLTYDPDGALRTLLAFAAAR